MYILSIDIGIKHLAHCLFHIDTKLSICDWDVIDLTGNIEETCNCKKKAHFFLDQSYYCKKHCPPEKTKDELIELCALHSIPVSKTLSRLKKSLIDYIIQPISIKKATQCSPVYLGKQLILKYKRFQVPIHTVLVENQIGPLANRMKALQGMVIQYWLMHGVNVECISACNKLKLFHTGKTTYAERKRLGIDHTRRLLQLNNLEHDFESHSKKDDLADTFLQGIWYFKVQLNTLNADYLKLSILT